MLSYEQAGLVLDELADELPEGIFENLNGGVNFVEEAVVAEDGRYTLGTYFRNGMGRYIELYYGSFVELYGEMDDELFKRRLKNTLHHELTHHIESMAGDRSLEHWDDRQSELCGFNGIDVGSILFVCDDNARSMAAEAVFNANKQGHSAAVTAYSAGLSAGNVLAPKFVKACENLNIGLPNRIPVEITRELLSSYDIALCMTLAQTDELSRRYQDLDERVMCLAEDDIKPPALALGWKKTLERLSDEVLAVIDELEQEAADAF